MNLVDDVNPVFSLCRRVLDLFPDLPDIFHAVVGSGVDLHHVQGSAFQNRPAGRTLIARTPVLWMFTVDSPCKDFRDTGLTCSAGAAEQVSMSDSLGYYLILQCLYNMVLAFYAVKGDRPPFPVQCHI